MPIKVQKQAQKMDKAQLIRIIQTLIYLPDLKPMLQQNLIG
jgi:hypothetical protein